MCAASFVGIEPRQRAAQASTSRASLVASSVHGAGTRIRVFGWFTHPAPPRPGTVCLLEVTKTTVPSARWRRISRSRRRFRVVRS